MDASVRLTVSGTVAGQLCNVSMPYPRQCWDGVSEADREALRLIARWRFSAWAYDEYGVRLPPEDVDALPVTVG
ncbi:hypothetical protein AB0469_31760 [Streptomyces sp. NPDC093801]|uniref:hypothetical protein n=1 Tax=Streptomyces sp. NPDC093801 TaxID=3155203 RepID=UPI00344B75EF